MLHISLRMESSRASRRGAARSRAAYRPSPSAERLCIQRALRAQQMGHDEKASAVAASRREKPPGEKKSSHKRARATIPRPRGGSGRENERRSCDRTGFSARARPRISNTRGPRDRDIGFRIDRSILYAGVQTPSVAAGAFLSYRNNSRGVLKSQGRISFSLYLYRGDYRPPEKC